VVASATASLQVRRSFEEGIAGDGAGTRTGARSGGEVGPRPEIV